MQGNVSHALESLKLMMVVSHAIALLLNFPKAVKANGSNKWNAVNPGKHQACLIPEAYILIIGIEFFPVSLANLTFFCFSPRGVDVLLRMKSITVWLQFIRDLALDRSH